MINEQWFQYYVQIRASSTNVIYLNFQIYGKLFFWVSKNIFFCMFHKNDQY